VVLCRRNMSWIRGTVRTGRCSSPEIEGQRRLLRSMSTRRIDPPQKQGVSNKKAAGEAIAIPFYLGVDTHRSTRCRRNDGARRAWRGFPSLLRCTSARCRRNDLALSKILIICHSNSFLFPKLFMQNVILVHFINFWIDPITQKIYNLHP